MCQLKVKTDKLRFLQDDPCSGDDFLASGEDWLRPRLHMVLSERQEVVDTDAIVFVGVPGHLVP